MRRKRYQTHEDVNPEVRQRMAAGLHPAVLAAARAAQAARTGGVAAPPPVAAPPGIQRVSGELPRQQANRPPAVAAPPAPGGSFTPGLDSQKLAASMGGSAADLGVQMNRQEGNPRGGQAFRRFMGGDGLEHHVYATGQDIRVKPRGTDQDRLVAFRAALAARDGTGNPAPPGPPDATGQPDLTPLQALPPEQQQALMALASAAAAQRQSSAEHPELGLMTRRRGRRR